MYFFKKLKNKLKDVVRYSLSFFSIEKINLGGGEKKYPKK